MTKIKALIVVELKDSDLGGLTLEETQVLVKMIAKTKGVNLIKIELEELSNDED